MIEDDFYVEDCVIEEFRQIAEYWAKQFNCNTSRIIMLYTKTAIYGIKNAKNYC